MIAAVKGWHALLGALLLCVPPGALAADDLAGAARELAGKTAAFAGTGQTVSVAWRNLSSLGSAGMAEARTAFEAALQQAGSHTPDSASTAEARLTLSENQSQFLLVEEIRKGEERQVWMATWNRGIPAAALPPGISLARRLVWEQGEPILDVAFPQDGLLVLSPGHVALYGRQNGSWERHGAIELKAPKPWPRDMRGHLRLNGSAFQVFLPGLACSGAVAPALAMDCRAAEDSWVLESGTRDLMAATFVPARNYFDGNVTAQNGRRRTVAPFYSAAPFEERGHTLWLLAALDGRTQVLNADLDPACGPAGAGCGGWTTWGSDIAGIQARCGGGSQVLATRSGDATETDAVQAFTIANGVPAALTAALDFAGPVTALWSMRDDSALAVERNAVSGVYRAYVVTVVCGS